MKKPRILVLAAALAALAIIAVSQTTVVGLPGSSAIIGAPGTWPATFPPSAHTHVAADVISGAFAIGQIPTGSTSTTVALGNHLHTGTYQPIITGAPGAWPAFGTAALQPSTAFTMMVGKIDALAQAANIAATPLYAVPAGGAGMYRVSCYITITQAATTSSTMPNCQTYWVDIDGSATIGTSLTPSSTVNTVGTTSANTVAIGQSGVLTINAKASGNINYATSLYASTGATPMLYAIHLKIEYLGI